MAPRLFQPLACCDSSSVSTCGSCEGSDFEACLSMMIPEITTTNTTPIAPRLSFALLSGSWDAQKGTVDSVVRRVRFSDVSIHYHPIILGDCPFVSCGPALSIDWKAMDSELHIPLDSLHLNDNLEQRRISKTTIQTTTSTPQLLSCKKRRSRELKLPAYRRHEILQQSGYTAEEIEAAVTEQHNRRLQKQLEQQQELLKFEQELKAKQQEHQQSLPVIMAWQPFDEPTTTKATTTSTSCSSRSSTKPLRLLASASSSSSSSSSSFTLSKKR